MSVVTEKQGFAAMFQFLDDYYMRTKSDEIGALLGAMSMLEDGSTADAAIAYDWRKAVGHVLNCQEAGPPEQMLTEQQAYASMLQFLKHPYMVTDSEEMVGLLRTMSELANGLPADPAISGYWKTAFEYAVNGGEAGKLVLGKR
jgi:hypothetical protein